jgi:hypothetical protein
MFTRLAALDAENPLLFRFSPEAQHRFIEFLVDLEFRLRGNSLGPVLASHLGKFRSLMPSLALLFELADLAAKGPIGGGRVSLVGSVGSVGYSAPTRFVSLENTDRAIKLCLYLESHAKRLYSFARTATQSASEELAFKILRHRLGTEFTARQVVQQSWHSLKSTEVVLEACNALEKAGWLRSVREGPGPKGGRPSLRFQVNPRVFETRDKAEPGT